MVFYNNLLTAVLLSVASFFAGDFGIFIGTPELHTVQYGGILLFSGENVTRETLLRVVCSV